MNITETMWLGLRNDREKALWLDAFWYGVEAGEKIQEEVRKLAENYTQETIQRNLGEIQERGKIHG